MMHERSEQIAKRKILVTGTTGFIGYHLAKKLLQRGDEVIGLDNINDYYDVNLKYARLAELGISREDTEAINILNSQLENLPPVSDLINDFGYKPDTSREVGIERFVKWYKEF